MDILLQQLVEFGASDAAGVGPKGPRELAVLLWVWFHLADPLLLVAKNSLMILACSQEAAMSSGTRPPSRSHFAPGSSCLLLKTSLGLCWSWGVSAAPADTNRPLTMQLFSVGCSWGPVLGTDAASPSLAAQTAVSEQLSSLCSSPTPWPRTVSHRSGAWRPKQIKKIKRER